MKSKRKSVKKYATVTKNGLQLSCTRSKRPALKARVETAWASKKKWSYCAWEREIEKIRQMACWGLSVGAGGDRKSAWI